MKIKMCEPLVSENAVRVGMAESSVSMDPSLPLQEDSLMMPPPVPNRSVSLGLAHKFLIYPLLLDSGSVLPRQITRWSYTSCVKLNGSARARGYFLITGEAGTDP